METASPRTQLEYRLSFAAGVLFATSLLAPNIALSLVPEEKPVDTSETAQDLREPSSEYVPLGSTLDSDPPLPSTELTSPPCTDKRPHASSIISQNNEAEQNHEMFYNSWSHLMLQFNAAGCGDILDDLFYGDNAQVLQNLRSAAWFTDALARLRGISPEDSLDERSDEGDETPIEYISSEDEGTVAPDSDEEVVRKRPRSDTTETKYRPEPVPTPPCAPIACPESVTFSQQPLIPKKLFHHIYDKKEEKGDKGDNKGKQEVKREKKRDLSKPYWLHARDLRRIKITVASPTSPSKRNNLEDAPEMSPSPPPSPKIKSKTSEKTLRRSTTSISAEARAIFANNYPGSDVTRNKRPRNQ